MKCPKCGEELEVYFNEYQDKDSDFVDVEFHCEWSQHCYFVRIRKEDLIESL